MDQISSFLLLGFEGTASDLLITFGLGGDATPPVVTTIDRGGRLPHAPRKLEELDPWREVEAEDARRRKLEEPVEPEPVAELPRPPEPQIGQAIRREIDPGPQVAATAAQLLASAERAAQEASPSAGAKRKNSYCNDTDGVTR